MRQLKPINEQLLGLNQALDALYHQFMSFAEGPESKVFLTNFVDS
jgi:hypothetical protein